MPLATRCLAASVDILPAPIRRTLLPSRVVKISRPSSTAAKLIDTAFSAMPVSVRTRLATAKARSKIRLRLGPIAPAPWAV